MDKFLLKYKELNQVVKLTPWANKKDPQQLTKPNNNKKQ